MGAYRTVYQDERLLAFERHDGEERYWVVINFGSEAITLELPALSGQILLYTHLDRTHRLANRIELRADEGVLIDLD